MDKKLITDLRASLDAALEWIEAVPKEVHAALPAMPGFDWDGAKALLVDHDPSPQPDPADAVARLLCQWAEYHEANWRLYLPKARDVIKTYLREAAD